MSIRIVEFDFDEHNEEKLWRHGITDSDVFAVHESDRMIVIRNKRNASGSHRMIGMDLRGRLLTIIIAPVSRSDGIWRPITGYESHPDEEAKWRNQ